MLILLSDLMDSSFLPRICSSQLCCIPLLAADLRSSGKAPPQRDVLPPHPPSPRRTLDRNEPGGVGAVSTASEEGVCSGPGSEQCASLYVYAGHTEDDYVTHS